MKITLIKNCYTFTFRKITVNFFCSEAIHKNKIFISNCIQTSAENNSFDIL